MKAANAEWHSLEHVDISRIESSELTALRTRAIEILREKCQKKIFALKDPRISRLLPFWQPVFDAIKIRVAYIIAIRNPISVSRSLGKRDQFPDEKSYLLWLAHIVPALQRTRGSLRAIVEYDKLLDDPRRELERISKRLNLPLDLERVHEFEQEFLESRLRHARFEAQDFAVVCSAPRQVGELFSALESASAKGDGELPRPVRPRYLLLKLISTTSHLSCIIWNGSSSGCRSCGKNARAANYMPRVCNASLKTPNRGCDRRKAS